MDFYKLEQCRKAAEPERIPMTAATEQPVRMIPSGGTERNQALDVLRGFALLGILLMNIQSFSMPDSAYLNPTVYGGLGGPHYAVWFLSHLFANSKFMTLFSVLFGASVLLFTDRAEARGHRAARLYYRRIGWLIVFGMLHAYLLWPGDILVTYGFCALSLYLFRKRSPRTLLLVGLLTLSVASLLCSLFQWSIPYWNEAAYANAAFYWTPPPEQIAYVLDVYRGSWIDQMAERVPSAFMSQTYLFVILLGWRAGGLMLIGMALFKKGVLTAQRSDRFYIGCILAGLLVGLPVVAYGAYRKIASGWSLEWSMFAGTQYNYWGSLLVSLGYIGLVMLACRRGWWTGLQGLLANVGRTAFSNYILQSLICTFIFYGHGLGLFGSVSRARQLLIVFAIWGVQVFLTHLWLKRFRFGPLEWLWRSLTYLKKPPMRLAADSGTQNIAP